MHSTQFAQTVDRTDYLKSAAIFFVVIDHFGYFFVENAEWWSVIGRLAAPVFFFLLGYAETRRVPLTWIVLGIFLTCLESWNADWEWVAPNILLSLAIVRLARPRVKALIQGRFVFVLSVLIVTLVALSPFTLKLIDYGTAGWLWSIFGLFQRLHNDSNTRDGAHAARSNAWAQNPSMMTTLAVGRIVIGAIALLIYIWLEQSEYDFSALQFMSFAAGVVALTLCLFNFARGPSTIQPDKLSARFLRFLGRHTLEIYAIQLALFEIIVRFVPSLGA